MFSAKGIVVYPHLVAREVLSRTHRPRIPAPMVMDDPGSVEQFNAPRPPHDCRRERGRALTGCAVILFDLARLKRADSHAAFVDAAVAEMKRTPATESNSISSEAAAWSFDEMRDEGWRRLSMPLGVRTDVVPLKLMFRGLP